MDISDSDEFTKRLVALGEYYDATLSPVKQAMYFEAMRDLPFTLVVRAMNLSMKSCTFMPKAAELRKLVVGDDEDTAEMAWLEYKSMARQIGGYQSPVFEDSALADALVAVFGSWEAACWSDFSPEMWSSKRKEFGRVYRAMRQRGETGPRRLAGFFQRENTLHGHVMPAALESGPAPAQLPPGDE